MGVGFVGILFLYSFLKPGSRLQASVVGRGAIFHDKEDNCVREEGPGGDLSAGARTGQCIIGLVAAPDKGEVPLGVRKVFGKQGVAGLWHGDLYCFGCFFL